MSEGCTVQAGAIFVKLVGVLSSAAESREIMLPIEESTTVQQLVSTLLKTVDKKFFRDLLVESGTEDPRPNVIILLNDQDCNLFNGLETQIEPGAKITMIPVAHGG